MLGSSLGGSVHLVLFVSVHRLGRVHWVKLSLLEVLRVAQLVKVLVLLLQAHLLRSVFIFDNYWSVISLLGSMTEGCDVDAARVTIFSRSGRV